MKRSLPENKGLNKTAMAKRIKISRQLWIDSSAQTQRMTFHTIHRAAAVDLQ
jgi:hypothetical protein